MVCASLDHFGVLGESSSHERSSRTVGGANELPRTHKERGGEDLGIFQRNRQGETSALLGETAHGSQSEGTRQQKRIRTFVSTVRC